MKIFLMICFSLFFFRKAVAQDLISQHADDSLSHQIDNSQNLLIVEETDSFDIFHSPTYFIFSDTKFFVDTLLKQMVKVVKQLGYYSNYLDSTKIESYFYRNNKLIKTERALIAKNTSVVRQFYFTDADLREWEAHGHRGPGTQDRENFMWEANHFYKRFLNNFRRL